MPVTRSARSRRAATRANTKRTILSALDENKPVTSEEIQSIKSEKSNEPDLDLYSDESVKTLLQDIRREVDTRKESLSIRGADLAKNQQEIFFVGTMKLEKSVKKMTIREFNHKFMNDGESIINVMKSIMIANEVKAAAVAEATAAAKKRVRDRPHPYTDLETPVRQMKLGKPCRTPGTILRTVRKGETMYSENGSPIDHNEKGDLVATVSKKRKGNGGSSDTIFDINIGDGRYISLSDPTTMEHLTSDIKNSAKNQLNVLQDQLSKLLSQLK